MAEVFTRRNLLGRSILLPAAVAALRSINVAAELPPIRRVGPARLRLGLNAYSFLEPLNANLQDPSQGIDLFGVCDFSAALELEAVDLTGYFFPGYPDAPPIDYLYRLKRHCHSLGLGISGTGVRNDFTAADKQVRAEGVRRIKTWVEVAARLGAPAVRVFADSQKPFSNWQAAAQGASRETVEAWMADDLRACAEHGAEFGVLIAVQNHGDFIATGEQHLSLLKRVDHAWCAALVDTGKYLTAEPYADISLVAPYAVNWQIKETTGSNLKSPPTDFSRLVKIIRESRYRGYVPIETLRMGRKDYDPRAEVTKMVNALRAAIGEA